MIDQYIKNFSTLRSDTSRSRWTARDNQSRQGCVVQALSLFGEGTLDAVDCVLAAKAAADGLTLLTFDKAKEKPSGPCPLA